MDTLLQGSINVYPVEAVYKTRRSRFKNGELFSETLSNRKTSSTKKLVGHNLNIATFFDFAEYPQFTNCYNKYAEETLYDGISNFETNG